LFSGVPGAGLIGCRNLLTLPFSPPRMVSNVVPDPPSRLDDPTRPPFFYVPLSAPDFSIIVTFMLCCLPGISPAFATVSYPLHVDLPPSGPVLPVQTVSSPVGSTLFFSLPPFHFDPPHMCPSSPLRFEQFFIFSARYLPLEPERIRFALVAPAGSSPRPQVACPLGDLTTYPQDGCSFPLFLLCCILSRFPPPPPPGTPKRRDSFSFF